MASGVKELMIQELRDCLGNNPYTFISSFDGSTVAEISEFRRGVEQHAGRSMVVKHSLAKRAFEGMDFSGAEKFLKGSVILTFGEKEPQAISKAIVQYAKSSKKFAPSGVIFERNVFGQDYVKQLAELPSREELLTQLVIRVQSPISGFVNTLSQVMRGLVQALNEIKKKREGAPAAA